MKKWNSPVVEEMTIKMTAKNDKSDKFFDDPFKHNHGCKAWKDGVCTCGAWGNLLDSQS